MPVSADEAVVGVASIEEVQTAAPDYQCCSFRGSVVAFNPITGKLRWQTYLISEAQAAAGSSGAAVWSTPTYDPKLDLIFVSTGNNYSGPATATSDAILALDPDDGRIVWDTQLHANDIWTARFPPGDPEHPDFDFGDSPQVFRLADGRAVVGAGQKSGFFHLLDARTGRRLDSIQVMPGGHLGGFFADSAFADGMTFANGSDWPLPVRLGEGGTGHVVAIRSSNRKLKVAWDFKTPNSPNLGAVAVANGVAYFLSSRSGDFYAVNTKTGKQLSRIRVGTGIAGPSISRGQVFIGTGDTYSFVNNAAAAGSLVALGLRGT
jgi:polyvinyl alcohol dehydrogenase (cytochrome)